MKAVKVEMTEAQAGLVRDTLSALVKSARLADEITKEVLWSGAAMMMAILTDDSSWVCNCGDPECGAVQGLGKAKKELQQATKVVGMLKNVFNGLL